MAPQIVQQIAEANSKGDLNDPYKLTIWVESIPLGKVM